MVALRRAVFAGAALAGALAACDSAAGAGCPLVEEQSLLQLRSNGGAAPAATSAGDAQRYDLAGKSVYLIMTDRFNRVDPQNETENPQCIQEQNWCGGTFKGITEKIPYIKGMGFDAIWITPVVKQSPLLDAPPPGSEQDCGDGSGYSYHGYWAENYYEVDPSYGTSRDLKDLVDAVHEAGMVFVLDIVLNHMRPIHPDPGFEVESIVPFDDPKYYHQLKPEDRPGGEDWVAYTEKYCKWPSPMQGLGAGTLCYLAEKDGVPDYTNGGNYCNVYKGNPFGTTEYTEENYLGTGPRNIKYCGTGNYCEGYNQTRVWEGWFYDLGDLNQDVPFVREMQFEWIRQMHANYSIDGIRLDTAPYVKWTYLKDFQQAAHPLQVIGEVTTSNISFHASFQNQGELGPVLAGMENFPPNYVATPGYCNDADSLSSPLAMGTLEPLADVMKQQIHGGEYTNLGTLMNFMDNQDSPPVAKICSQDTALIKNGLAWAMFSYGMPVITWGTEQGNDVYRNTLWTLGFSTETWQYQFIKKMNEVRKETGIAVSTTEVVHSSKNHLVFVRRCRKTGVWVFTNNLNTTGTVTYDVAPPLPPRGKEWHDAVSGQKAALSGHRYVAPSNEPVVLFLADKGD